MKIKELDEINKPYKIFAEFLEQEAIDQFVAVMGLDTVVKGALISSM